MRITGDASGSSLTPHQGTPVRLFVLALTVVVIAPPVSAQGGASLLLTRAELSAELRESRLVLLRVGSLLSVVKVGAQQSGQRPLDINGGLPAVSPDGQHIAYIAMRGTANAALRVVRADGRDDRLLADGVRGAVAWMGDGRRVLYQGAGGLQAVALDGSPDRVLPVAEGRGYVPSPDGRSLLYSNGAPPEVRLMVGNLDGTSPRTLVSGRGMAFNGAWSPDGRRIAYSWIDSTRAMQVWIVNADGSGARQLTHFTESEGRPQWPSWSPDGMRLAVQAGVRTGTGPGQITSHIWLIDARTGQAKKLAPHDAKYLDETPSFFPDGSRIAFQSDRTGRMEIWVMDVDGTNPRQVTR